MLQDGGVYPGIRPAEALRLFAAFYADAATIPASCSTGSGWPRVARSTWRQLSGGEQQRLSLALALVGRARRWPSSTSRPPASTWPAARSAAGGHPASCADAGCCVLLTTHELDEAERVADRVVIVDRGRLRGRGHAGRAALAGRRAAEIRFGAAPALDVAVAAAPPWAAGRRGVARRVRRGHVAPTPATVAALTAWLAEHDLPLADLRAGRQRLEDVFLRLTAPTETAP